MANDQKIQTTFGEALGDLRDKVASMPNWSKVYDSTGGATSGYGGKWAWETPTGEYIEVSHFSGSSNAIDFTYGVDYDTTNGGWNDKYDNPSGTVSPSSKKQADESSTVEYWISYADSVGFMVYMVKNDGSSDDSDFFTGCAKLAKTWDYDSAAVREGDYVWSLHDSGNNTSRNNITAEGGVADETYNAKGALNPDTNYNNYPLQETNAVCSNKYTNGNGYSVVIGKHSAWLRDKSGSETAHGDTIQDSGGTNEYIILKARNQNKPRAMKLL